MQAGSTLNASLSANGEMLLSAPAGVTLANGTTLQWTPAANQVGVHTVDVLTDSGIVRMTITVTAVPVGSPPQLTTTVFGPPASGSVINLPVNGSLRILVAIRDADGDAVALLSPASSAWGTVSSGLPAGAQLKIGTGPFPVGWLDYELTWNPATSQAGQSFQIRFSATDGRTTVSRDFQVNVINSIDFVDGFNRNNATGLGLGWTPGISSFGTVNNALAASTVLASGGVVQDTTSAAERTNLVTASNSANVTVSADISVPVSSSLRDGHYIGLTARDNGSSRYTAEVGCYLGGRVCALRLKKSISGVKQTLSTASFSSSAPVTANLRISFSGNQIYGCYGDRACVSATDSSILGAGKVGVVGTSGGLVLDNFQADY